MAYTGTSIVDYLKSLGQASDYTTRTALAKKYGISNYSGTADQNNQLLAAMRGGSAPAPAPTPAPTTTASSIGSGFKIDASGQLVPINTPAPIPYTPQPYSSPMSTTTPAVSTQAYQQPAPAAQPTYQPTGMSVPAPTAPAASSTSARTNLEPGQSGQDVKELQQWLMDNGYAIKDGATGYYGPQTTAAVTQLQKDLGVNPGNYPGYFGPLTIKAVQGVLSGTGTYKGQSATPSSSGAPSQQQSAPGAQPGASPAVTPNTQTEMVTGDPKLDSILGALKTFVDKNLALGNVVNPALQITPDLVTKFLAEAHTQVDPYYQQQLSSVIQDVNRSLGQLSESYGLQKGQQQADFQNTLATTRESEAGAGTAFSGLRTLNEGRALDTQNRTLDSLGISTAVKAGDILRAGASKVGSDTLGLSGNLNSFNIPGLSSEKATLDGARGGVAAGGALDLGFNPSLYKFGEIPSKYASDLTNSANQFLSSYQKSAGNNSARTFANLNGTPTLM